MTTISESEDWYYRVNTRRKTDIRGIRKGNSQLQYNWPKIIVKIDEVLKQVEKQGFKPTMRQLNYALIVLKAIPNLHKTYNSLDKFMVKAREEKHFFEIDCLADDRHPIQDFDDRYLKPNDHIAYYVDELRNIATNYRNDVESFPRWWNQKNYVEIWTEKQAMTKYFISTVKKYNLQVRIVPFGGFPGTTELNECVIRLKEKMVQGMNVHILWYGDLDPSGESIDRTTIRKLKEVREWSLYNYAKSKGVIFSLERIAVTKEQIYELDLPWDAEHMSEDEQEKLENDPRYKKHLEEHGQIYACEVDSLPIRNLDAFNKIAVESVNKYFDEDIYNDGLEDHKEKYTE